MDIKRPANTQALEEMEGTTIIPKSDGNFRKELFQLSFEHEDLEKFRGLVKEILSRRGEDYMELDFDALALLIWEHKQYSEAQEFSVSAVRVHRAVQSITQYQDRFFPRDIESHPLTEHYSEQTIRNGLSKLVKEGFVEKGDAPGEYYYTGPMQYVPPNDSVPLNDIDAKLNDENKSGT